MPKKTINSDKSEEKYVKAFHSNPAIMGFSDLETGTYTDVNKAFYDILGFTPEEVIGKKSKDVLYLDKKFRDESVKKLEAQGFLRNEEAIIYCKDGTKIYVLLNAEIVEINKKKHIMTTAVNINQLKLTEKQFELQKNLAIELSKKSSPDEIFDSILNHIFKLEEFDSGGIYLIDKKTGSINLKYHSGLPQEFVEKVKHYDFDDFRTQKIMSGDPFYISIADAPEDMQKELELAEIISFAVVPIKFGEHVIGAFNLASRSHLDISYHSRKTLESISQVEAGVAINRILAEQASRESENKYKSLFEHMQNGAIMIEIIFDETGIPIDYVFLEINKAFEDQTSLKKKALMGKKVTEAFPGIENDLADWIGTFGNVSMTGISANFEIYSKMLEQWFLIIAYKTNEGRVAAIFQNISNSKLAEKALEKSKERLSTALYGSKSGIWDRIIDTGEMFFDDNYYKLSGYMPNEFPQKYKEFKKRVHPDEIEEAEKKINSCISGTAMTYLAEFRFKKKNGDWMWILSQGKIVEYDEFGTPVRFTGTHIDITERKQVEEDKKKLEIQLLQSQKWESIATLAGGIAHQFNNAISGIIGNVDLLEMDFSGFEEITSYTENIKISSIRMARLAQQLLAYARGGKYKEKIISGSELIRETLSFIDHSIDNDIKIEKDISDQVSLINVDVTQMQMVISAIMSNASEAIEDRGRIRITCKNIGISKKKNISIPDLKAGNYYRIKIEDNGKGMDEETRTRVFEPFFTTNYEGRGLGMAAADGIIKNHGGLITVDSKLGKGTIVIIYLPIVKSPAKTIKKSNIEADTTKNSGTIFVIEDERMVLEMITKQLERLGYRVLSAETGKEAIEFAETFDGEIDLAILDMILPDMGGKTIFKGIMKARPELKVIVCSGYSIDGPAREILNDGAKYFIQKPFRMKELSELLKKTLRARV